LRIAVPCVKSGEKLYVSMHFGRAPFLAIYDVDGEAKLVKLERIPYGGEHEHEHGHGHGHGGGHAIMDLIANYGVEAIIAYNLGYGAFYRLRDAGVKIYLVDRTIPVEEALKLLIEGKLREASEPREHH